MAEEKKENVFHKVLHNIRQRVMTLPCSTGDGYHIRTVLINLVEAMLIEDGDEAIVHELRAAAVKATHREIPGVQIITTPMMVDSSSVPVRHIAQDDPDNMEAGAGSVRFEQAMKGATITQMPIPAGAGKVPSDGEVEIVPAGMDISEARRTHDAALREFLNRPNGA